MGSNSALTSEHLLSICTMKTDAGVENIWPGIETQFPSHELARIAVNNRSGIHHCLRGSVLPTQLMSD